MAVHKLIIKDCLLYKFEIQTVKAAQISDMMFGGDKDSNFTVQKWPRQFSVTNELLKDALIKDSHYVLIMMN